EDVCFLMTSERCCYELPFTDCYSQSWDEGTAYWWKAPHDAYGIIDYAQRFTVTGVETLQSVDIDVYDFTGSSSQNAGIVGNDDLIISVWDDNAGYPGSVIAQETVPAGTYVYHPAYTNVDFSSHNLVLGSGDFYVSFNSTGDLGAGDFEGTLSDDETDGHGRSYCIYGGDWWTIGDLFGIDVDMKYTANLCDDPFFECELASTTRVRSITGLCRMLTATSPMPS
ncbi:MAG: hypothetical protein OEV80_13095, partial [candidate division Zixibacteria bacterium]|nr:hypothetical protein [candidate division Zixibacteria bacterium]